MIKFSTDSIHYEESVRGKFLHIGIVCVGSVSCAPYVHNQIVIYISRELQHLGMQIANNGM